MSEERRREDQSMKTDIEVLKNDVRYIKDMLSSNFSQFNEHVKTAQPFRDKVLAVDQLKQAFDGHVVSDRWGFGIIISLLLAILTKSMNAW